MIWKVLFCVFVWWCLACAISGLDAPPLCVAAAATAAAAIAVIALISCLAPHYSIFMNSVVVATVLFMHLPPAALKK